MAKSSPLQAGYGNGGIDTMDQFEKLSDKITNSLKNLEFTRDMLRQLAENEKKSAKTIQQILNPLKQINKNKTLRFSVVDRAIQNYWKKQEQDRRLFAAALQTKIIDELDEYISSARDQKKKLTKENTKTQRTFIECKKETAKQKQIGLKEWQKLEEQIQKNDQLKKTNKLTKIKDLKPAQDKCSKAFAKYESYVSKLNELEQHNHANACKVGELLHKSQKYAADRLSMHYNIAVSTSKYLNEFIKSNKSIVQSKAPPLSDILWRWLSYPKNHQTLHTLPCTSKEVFNKESIGQSFKRRVEPDFQPSQYLKPPKQQQQPQSQPQPKQQQKQTKQERKHKKKGKKKGKKHTAAPQQPKQPEPDSEPQPQPHAQPVDDWNVDFGPENNDDIFGSIDDTKQPPIEKKQEPMQKDLVQQHKENTATTNGFDDTGFGDDFGDFENKDLNIVDSNPGADVGGGGGFGGNWDETDINFDEQLFAQDNDTNNATPQEQTENVDDLFAADGAKDDKTSTNDIFASFDFDANANTTIKAIDAANNANINTDLDNACTVLFDEFDEQEITFPEFDNFTYDEMNDIAQNVIDKGHATVPVGVSQPNPNKSIQNALLQSLRYRINERPFMAIMCSDSENESEDMDQWMMMCPSGNAGHYTTPPKQQNNHDNNKDANDQSDSNDNNQSNHNEPNNRDSFGSGSGSNGSNDDDKDSDEDDKESKDPNEDDETNESETDQFVYFLMNDIEKCDDTKLCEVLSSFSDACINKVLAGIQDVYNKKIQIDKARQAMTKPNKKKKTSKSKPKIRRHADSNIQCLNPLQIRSQYQIYTSFTAEYMPSKLIEMSSIDSDADVAGIAYDYVIKSLAINRDNCYVNPEDTLKV
eukprot:177785_1